MPPRYGFGKIEKLKSRKQIETLFRAGKSFSVFLLRVTWHLLKEEQDAPVKAGVTVGKKHFKKAVDRNRIKRLLREAYRLQKEPLLQAAEASGKRLHLFIQYNGKQLPQFLEIRVAMEKLLRSLLTKIRESENADAT